MNRLVHEKSPYLLQHANNPVAWFPWGEEAFEKARRENKPIFLSIGYSTCHWCHVMAHESFEDQETAAIMNREFVNIKVDREERPDVDRVYMTFVQATTGGGGWPMSVWLTPELKPFIGGTYFPPEDRYGQPGFKKVLERIASAWKENAAKIAEQGSKIVEALRESQAAQSSAADKIDIGVFEKAYEQFERSYDPREGGFSIAPKFPRPVTLNFLTRFYARDPKTEKGKHALEMALFTLQKMASGGCTIISAAVSIVIRSTATGTYRISKRCFTIKRSLPRLISTRFRSPGIDNMPMSPPIFWNTSREI